MRRAYIFYVLNNQRFTYANVLLEHFSSAHYKLNYNKSKVDQENNPVD